MRRKVPPVSEPEDQTSRVELLLAVRRLTTEVAELRKEVRALSQRPVPPYYPVYPYVPTYIAPNTDGAYSAEPAAEGRRSKLPWRKR